MQEHYQAMAEKTQARIIACRYLLQQPDDADTLALTVDCLRLLDASDNEIHQAMADRQCDGQCDVSSQENGI